MALAVIESPSLRLDPARLPSARVEALYVHVPFCFHKCHYCDFYSITRQTPQRMARFVDLVLRDADQWTDVAQLTFRPRTIFFGGGTPTLLHIEPMARLLDGLRRRFDLSSVDEWTIEANPATVTSDYCRMLRAAGVNRISFGAQSFDPVELKMLERHHDPEDVPRGLEMARSAGFERINLDLIFAIPGQSLASWERSLERTIELGTSHVSCYGLTYEPNTPITVRKRLGQVRSVEESVELEMLHHARRRLGDAGLPPYEISNNARSGEECRHNLVYWTGGNYLALGPSAASHIEGWRWRNRPHLGEWERAVESDALPAIEVETLSASRRAGELAMLMLRLTRGVNFAEFQARLGMDPRAIWSDTIDRLVRAGLLWKNDQGFGLSESGLVVADALSAEFVDPETAFPDNSA